MKNVTLIPARTERFHAAAEPQRKRRVAGYARVSTDKDDQFTSYQAQIDYYTSFIKSRTDWTFVNVYTDEGISGTSTKHREGFKQMVSDALAGKIDLIVTKSVSRFARNTVDSLTTIRTLKEKNVECYFEKENIWTFDGKGEVLITIMSSLAQEESRSISENCTWGQRKRMADGRVSVAYSRFLGYRKGDNNSMEIVEEEASVIRKIYSMFLHCSSYGTIAKHLTDSGIKTPAGKDRWSVSTVRSILSNEKYKGDALMQKTYTADFLTKKSVKNNGELQQYYVKESHPAIISPEVFDIVQSEIVRRSGKAASGSNVFSGRIFCGYCGGMFGSKVWHSTDKYKTVIWQCNDKYSGNAKCENRHIREDEIKEEFLKAVNLLVADEVNVVAQLMNAKVFDTTELEKTVGELQRELNKVNTEINREIQINSCVAQNQEEFDRRYSELCKRFEEISDELSEKQNEIESLKERAAKAQVFCNNLKKLQTPVLQWSDELWTTLVDKAIVTKESIKFIWSDGSQ